MEKTPLDEYKEAGANMRHFGTHYTAFLGLFLAFTGGLLSVLFGAKPPESHTALVTLRVFGLAMTLLFWVMTESVHYLWGHFLRRAAEIESQLEFRLYSSLPGSPCFRIRPVAWATRIMLFGATAFWLFLLFSSTKP